MRFTIILLAIPLFTSCQQLKKLYPIVGAGGGAAVGSLGGPGTAAAGGMLGYAAGKEMAEPFVPEYSLMTAPDLTRISAVESLTQPEVTKLVEAQLAQQKAELEASQKSWGDKAVGEVKGLLRLSLWIGGIAFLLFVVIIPFLHKHGITTIRDKLHKEFEEQWEKLKK